MKFFLQKERDFIADMDKLSDIFCQNPSRRRELKKQNNLPMSDKGYSFYEDQKDQCKNCLDIVELPDLGNFFSQQHKGQERKPSCKFRLFFSIRF